MSLLYIFLLGISLSIDAFSLSVSLGIYKRRYNDYVYSIVTGVYHYFMPIMGYIIKRFFYLYIILDKKMILSFVLLFIILSILFDKTEVTNKILNPLIFGFTISLDSFSIGLTLDYESLLFSCFIFSVISTLMTYIGFKLSNVIKNNFSKYSKTISLLTLILLLIRNML